MAAQTSPVQPAQPSSVNAFLGALIHGIKVANGEFARHLQVRGWVPLDDEHTMYCVLWWKRGASAMTQEAPAFKDGTPVGGMGRRNDFLPNTTDWLGRFRLAANASNDWGMDRAACERSIRDAGLPVPPKSSCWFCPASKKHEIVWLREHHPDLLERALAIEAGAKPNLTSVVGLGRSFAWSDFLADLDDTPLFPCGG